MASEVAGPSRTPVAVVGPSPRDAAGKAGATGATEEEGLRISYRILLYIARQGRLGPGEVAPESLTQAGMAEALEVGRSGLSNALRRLSDGGVLAVRSAHVRGRPTRLKVYQLTSEGEQVVQELRRRFRGGRHPPR
jgi:hypothetical protein